MFNVDDPEVEGSNFTLGQSQPTKLGKTNLLLSSFEGGKGKATYQSSDRDGISTTIVKQHLFKSTEQKKLAISFDVYG